MPTAPDLDDVKAYLASIDASSWPDDQVQDALDAELANQIRVCKLPVDPAPPAAPLPWPDDLADALCRRVARNLALRQLPLGVQAGGAENIVRVGGLDAEVRRLEGPHRKVLLG